MKINAKNISDAEYFYGHKACAGCGGSLAVRIALKVLGERTIAVIPAGCMSAVGFNFPHLCFRNNAIISTFAGTASMMTGVEAGLRSQGIEDYQVVGFAGDGGTADIGLQALSGAIDRGDNILYICYDNEAYMNTGIQKSSLTPYGTRTTTSPVGKEMRGNQRNKKNIFEIIAAHHIDYAATASIGYLEDYMMKIDKAMRIKGTKFIHVIAPCPTGWGTPVEDTIELAREIVDTGLWKLMEYENGEFTTTFEPKEQKSIEHYIRRQKRFKHMTDEDFIIISVGLFIHKDLSYIYCNKDI